MMEAIGPLLNLIIFLLLVSVGYFAGTLAEKRHYQSIQKREAAWLRIPAVSARFDEKLPQASGGEMVYGSAVISIDYFKRILAGLRIIFGGRVTAYESLIDRARREAILRMKENAGPNTDIILNVRIETSSIGNSANGGSVGSIEALAYGTAIRTSQNG